MSNELSPATSLTDELATGGLQLKVIDSLLVDHTPGEMQRAAATLLGDDKASYDALRSRVNEFSFAVVSDADMFDLLVIGNGPAGLASAAGAAAEGLTSLIIEGVLRESPTEAWSGQAPDKITTSGMPGMVPDVASARRFGFRLATARAATGLSSSSSGHKLQLEGGQSVGARAIIAATGAHYRRLDVANSKAFEFRGLHYAATGMEAALCAGEDVLVVGGGNSAGQAAVFLEGTARHVHLLTRGDGLQAGVSAYLAARLTNSSSVTIYPYSEVIGLDGDISLERVTWESTRTGICRTMRIHHIFVMIGAVANSGWLHDQVELDECGFVRAETTGLDGGIGFQASCPGIFAVGDIRSGSVKRIAAAMREGSAVVTEVRRYLNEPKQKRG